MIAFDPRGNGRSDRPADVSLYSEDENAADIGAVLDATGTERAVLVTMSRGCQRTLLFAAEQPHRVEGAVFMSCGTLLSPERRETDDAHAADPPRPRRPGRCAARHQLLQSRGLAARPRDLSVVPGLVLRDLLRRAFDEADRGRPRLGPRDRRDHARRNPSGPADRRRADARALRPHSVSHARDPRNRRPDHAVRGGRSPGRDAGNAPRGGRRLGPRADGAKARAGESRVARVPRARLRARARSAASPSRTARAASACSTSRRPSASAMRSATSRSRERCGDGWTASRSIGWRSIP